MCKKSFEPGDETVDIGDKEIGDAGGVRIAAMLAKSTSVRKLSMGRCKLTVKTACALANAILKNKSLVELILYSKFARRPCAA